MASPTDIANLALSLIGEPPIADIADTDEVSVTCAVNYGQARDECLAMSRWGFAKSQKTLSRLSTGPLIKWTSAFTLPPDFIRLCEIGGYDAWLPAEFYDVQGKRLLTGLYDDDTTTVTIEYIRREEDSTFYSPLFIKALSYCLANMICVKLTSSDAKARGLLQTLEQVVMPKAMTIDAQQRYSGENHPLRKILRRSALIRSRGPASDDF